MGKIRKPKVKNSELKRKNWRMLCSQSSLNCTNRVVDHPHQVEKEAKKTSIRMSCKSCCYIGIVSSFLADVSSHPRFSSKSHTIDGDISNIYKTFLRDLDLHQEQVQ